MYKFAPSLMCMDFTRFKEQIEFLDTVSAYFHIDIMDGHFVPNITLSPSFISQISGWTKTPTDAHLMVENPSLIAPLCIEAGASMVSFHVETINGTAFRLINQMKQNGKQVGLVLNPETKPDAADYYLSFADKVTLMTVDPGFAGQPFIREVLGKVEKFRELKEKRGYKYLIEIDGACNRKTFGDLAKAGTEVFIVGTSGLFNLDPDIRIAWEKMNEEFGAAVSC